MPKVRCLFRLEPDEEKKTAQKAFPRGTDDVYV